MKVVGVDLDGIITKVGFYNPSIRLPWRLFYLLVPVILLLKPDRVKAEKLQLIKNKGCEIIIVTARPVQLTQITKQWLIFYNIPFDSLFCVGFGKGTNERKLKVIRDEKMEVYIDNDSRAVEFMQRNSVKAVSSLDYLN